MSLNGLDNKKVLFLLELIKFDEPTRVSLDSKFRFNLNINFTDLNGHPSKSPQKRIFLW